MSPTLKAHRLIGNAARACARIPVLCLIAPALLFPACPHAATITYKRVSNLPYSQEPEEQQTDYQKERCVLDLYYPEKRTGFATVVWYHGGGLTAGNKHFPGLTGKHLGLVAVNYRLHPGVSCETAISDAAAALAWTFKNIATYGGDPTLIFVSGSSAGGYLTSMLGFDKRWLAKYGVDADAIKGLIPYTGHTITHMTVRKERYALNSRIPVIDEFAPIYHARADAPPVLLLTGDRRLEMLGRCEENELFYRVLKNIGHPHVEHLEFEGYGHGMSHPANPVALKWITKVIGCSPKALIVPLDYSWSYTKRDRKYPWRNRGTNAENEKKKPSVELLTAVGREGSGCLAVRDISTATNAYGESPALPVRPGREYVLTGWVKNEEVGDGIAGVCFNVTQSGRIRKQTKNTRFPATAEWSRFEVACPPVAEGMDGLILYILPRPPGQPNTTTGAVLFDDLRICEQPKAKQ
ncbi:MAG: carboxylesterase family protein [Lentisphaerae bacterium]|jgi:acetyl esterase/lipase|nr:carboxylesterase family protein [Lentisphaerota bacterium]MBT4818530.1 carboxylesterase family protein [Lentisphaerota bacterium]MBT5605680.1 carboxylesterase family protein [Lentisphaerota bacterium]MBT7056301.1 carboxylesterase family protein [Lentisphaerota bacterium]MBT7843660.1 carboxylesterase family protein [Lentisphaerota bacterium]